MSVTRIELSLETVKSLMAKSTGWVLSNDSDKIPTHQYVESHSCGSIYFTKMSGFHWTPKWVKEAKGVFVIEQHDFYTHTYLQIEGSDLKFELSIDEVEHNINVWDQTAKDFFMEHLRDYFD